MTPSESRCPRSGGRGDTATAAERARSGASSATRPAATQDASRARASRPRARPARSSRLVPASSGGIAARRFEARRPPRTPLPWTNVVPFEGLVYRRFLRLLGATGAAVVAIAGVVALPREAAAQGFALNRFEPRRARQPVVRARSPRPPRAPPTRRRPRARLPVPAHRHQAGRGLGRDDRRRRARRHHARARTSSSGIASGSAPRCHPLFYNEGRARAPPRSDHPGASRPAGRQRPLRFGADARLFGTSAGPITMAFGGRFWVPTGSPASYTGDGFVRWRARLSAAGRWACSCTAPASAPCSTTQSPGVVGEVPIDHDLVYSVSAGLSLVNGRVTVAPELYGSTVLGNETFKTRTSPRSDPRRARRITHGLRGGIGVGKGLVAGFGSPEVRCSPRSNGRCRTGSQWSSRAAADADNDGDGIADEVDACP